MLQPKVIPEVLSEALSPGVTTAILVNRSGLLLGSAGEVASAALLGAIVSNMWVCHETCGGDGAGALGCLLVDCDEGRLALKSVGGFILVCRADATVPHGLLKAKAQALADVLSPSLSTLT
jgi:hypothetical protein